MKAKIVYGCPCSGKSTYTREHAGKADVIYDYDALVLAMTTRDKHLVDRHAAHFLILGLRKAIVRKKKESTVSGSSAGGQQKPLKKSCLVWTQKKSLSKPRKKSAMKDLKLMTRGPTRMRGERSLTIGF